MNRLLTRRRQSGVAVVEFAIVGALALILIFAVLEIARAFFVANALTEATRRGARMAVVCPVNDPAIAQVATFNAPGAGNATSCCDTWTGTAWRSRIQIRLCLPIS